MTEPFSSRRSRPELLSPPAAARLGAVILCLPVLAACTSPQGTSAPLTSAPTSAATASSTGGASSSCLFGTTDCVDIAPGATPDTAGVVSGADGSVPIGLAVRESIDGPFLISAFYLAGPGGARLCTMLRESMPPQCGAPALRVDLGSRATELLAAGAPTTQAGVTWSTRTITLEGSIVGDAFVLRAA